MTMGLGPTHPILQFEILGFRVQDLGFSKGFRENSSGPRVILHPKSQSDRLQGCRVPGSTRRVCDSGQWGLGF